MEESRKSKSSQHGACLECQKRKTKCVPNSEEPPSCAYCVKAGKRCVFEAPPSRTPLTRKNLDAAERRCRQLEALLRAVSPGIDIDAVLADGFSAKAEEQEASAAEDDTEESCPDEVFGWDEAPASPGLVTREVTSDGMALTPTAQSGYLGSSSASEILQTICAIIRQNEPNPSPGGSSVTVSLKPKSTEASKLALNASLISSAVVNRYIDAYFLFYNSYYPIVHERTFREKWEKRLKIRRWMPIIYMVMAIGQWVLGEVEEESPYYACARSWISAQVLESGTVTAVQAFLLMGNYVQKRDRPNTAYNVMGIAYRMALGLGMHRETSKEVQDTLGLERRRALFWTLFCFDSGFSMTTGRPATFIDAFVDVHIPRNIDDSECTFASRVPDEVACPTSYSSLIALGRLSLLANEIYTKFLSVRFQRVETNHEMALAMEGKLDYWRSTTPTYFTGTDVPRWFLGPRATVRWKEQNLRILLWRGSQRHHITESGKLEAGMRYKTAALEAIADVTSFCRNNVAILHIGLNWYATYFLFQAMLVLEVHRLETRSLPHITSPNVLLEGAAWEEAMKRGRECLHILDTPKSAAGRCLEALDRIHKHASSMAYATPEPLDHPSTSSAVSSIEPETLVSGPVTSQWATMTVEPSFQSLLFGDHQIDDLFRDVGVPRTFDQQEFNDVPGEFYGM